MSNNDISFVKSFMTSISHLDCMVLCCVQQRDLFPVFVVFSTFIVLFSINQSIKTCFKAPQVACTLRSKKGSHKTHGVRPNSVNLKPIFKILPLADSAVSLPENNYYKIPLHLKRVATLPLKYL